LPFTRADSPADVNAGGYGTVSDEERDASGLTAVRNFLEVPFSEIRPYSEYVRGESPFATHQGVKGLEFPRVMVIMDDEDAGGFLFSFEKLFGARDKTSTDLKNEQTGSETGIDRTRRLFYVTCSRSQSSLALLAYSVDPEKVRETLLKEEWFEENEIESLS
jgi:DNA helicase II / ATP-dependent DNA helicase PcrA